VAINISLPWSEKRIQLLHLYRDPLVGRDILIGALFGVVMMLATSMASSGCAGLVRHRNQNSFREEKRKQMATFTIG